MHKTLRQASRLALVFVATFSISFVQSSLTLSDLLDVPLEWQNLPQGLSIVGHKAGAMLQSTGAHLARTLQGGALAYRDVLILLGDSIAYAEPRTKVTIYSANGSDTPRIALTAEEIRAKRSSFSILVDNRHSNIYNFIYYSQHDPRWKDYAIAGKDPIDTYGCGPTALAMIISNLSKSGFTPDKAAEWAQQNGYYMQGSGSYHSLIVKGANAFSIDARSYPDYSEAALRQELEKGNIFVALMRPGVFSRASNHFILLLGLDAEGKVLIAEPNSAERTEQRWELDFLLQELQYRANNGGPLWLISLS